MKKLFVNVDGSSHGNPGDAAIGVVISSEDGTTLEEISRSIGRATNNMAEYKALLEGCRAALEYAPKEAIFFTDSQLVANQINGVYRVKKPHLQNLKQKASDLLNRFSSWSVRFVDRGANWEAHRLSQKPLQQETSQEKDISSTLREKIDNLSIADQEKVLKFLNELRKTAD